MEHAKALSASSIKSLETCSWLYWCQYANKIPQRSNEGAMRGTCVHLIFELLIQDKHRKHYDAIMQAGNIKGSPAICRLVIKLLRKDRILTTTNYDMVNDMILVGLRTDFFGLEGKEQGFLGEPEYRFEIISDDPKYRIRGYIDKIVFYKKGRIKIVDYKSSKQKFRGDELDANVQSMAYSLAGYKVLGATDVTTEFIFLRFPRQPIQAVHLTQEQLKGFEHYLAYIYELINDFDLKDAQSNMAAFSDKNSWLCKAGKWECPYFKGFSYYALVNKDGTIARTSMKNDLDAQPGQELKVLKYAGCPAHKTIKKGL
jgi:hypothetical protein